MKDIKDSYIPVLVEEEIPLGLEPVREFLPLPDKSRLITWRLDAAFYKADDIRF